MNSRENCTKLFRKISKVLKSGKQDIVKINNETIPTSTNYATIIKDVLQGDKKMKFVLATDRYASEISFKIFNPDGTVLLQDGPYNDLGSDGITVREYDFIPVMTGCYSVEVYDSYGDGINIGYGNGYIKIYNELDNEIYYNDGQFGSKATVMVLVNTVGVKEIYGDAINITPNPVKDKLYITGTYNQLQIITITGQVMVTSYGASSIDVNNLAKGIYIVKVQTSSHIYSFKVVK